VLVNILCLEKYGARKETALVNCAQKRTLSTVLVYCARKTALSNILGLKKYCGRDKTALENCVFQYTALSMRRLVKYSAWKNTLLGQRCFPTALRNGRCKLCLHTELGKLRSVIYSGLTNTTIRKKVLRNCAFQDLFGLLTNLFF